MEGNLRVRMKFLRVAQRSICPRAIDLAVGLPPVGAVAQSNDDPKVCASALALAARLQSSVDIRIQRRSRTGRQHTDHCIRFALQLNCLPDQMRIGVKSRAPQAVREDHSVGAMGAIFVLSEDPADHWPKTEHIEIVSRDAPRMYVLHASSGQKIHPGRDGTI